MTFTGIAGIPPAGLALLPEHDIVPASAPSAIARQHFLMYCREKVSITVGSRAKCQQPFLYALRHDNPNLPSFKASKSKSQPSFAI